MKTPTNNGIEALADIFPWNLALAVIMWLDKDPTEHYDGLMRVYAPGLIEAIGTLTEREQHVLMRRYRDGATLEQVGQELGVLRERTRQIEGKALRKLRHPARREMYELVTRAEYHQLRQDYWELLGRYERVKEEAMDEALRNMYDAEGQISEVKREITAQQMAMPITELELSVRSCNCLKRAGLKTVGDLVSMPLGKLERVRNFGRKSCEEVLDRLKALGITPRYEDGSAYEDRHRRSR